MWPTARVYIGNKAETYGMSGTVQATPRLQEDFQTATLQVELYRLGENNQGKRRKINARKERNF